MEKKDQDINRTEIKEQLLIHDFNKENLKNAFTVKVIALLVGVIIIGIISGYIFAARSGTLVSAGTTTSAGSDSAAVTKGAVFGSNDTKTFKDIVEGVLKEGGIDGEGAFHLERPGGVSQNVYLTSSSLDLSKFIDKKIKIWGQTQKAQHAGWLMDVGRVEVL